MSGGTGSTENERNVKESLIIKITEKNHSKSDLKGVKRYTASFEAYGGIHRSNFALFEDNHFILFKTGKGNGTHEVYGVAHTPEEADKKAYDHAKNILVGDVNNRYEQIKDTSKEAIVEFVDSTERGKLEQKTIEFDD